MTSRRRRCGRRLDSLASVQRSKSGNNSAVNKFTTGLDASWELDIFGANRSALATSEATVQASAASLGDVQVSIAAEVALAYITLRDAQARLVIAHEQPGQSAGDVADHPVAFAGRAGHLNRSRTGTYRGRTAPRRSCQTLQTSIEQTAHALAVLIGQPPASLLTLLAAAKPVPQARG